MDLVSKAIEVMCKEIEAKRKEIILGRLKKLGIELDMELERTRRFKSLTIETEHDGTETIYYNDGSENGIRVVTFVAKRFPYNPETCSILCESSYY